MPLKTPPQQGAMDFQTAIQERSWRYPIVIKPVKGAGSYYCRKVERESELQGIVQHLCFCSRTEGKFPKNDASAGWLIEEFFEGQEVDVSDDVYG